jgi:hypothetical protein
MAHEGEVEFGFFCLRFGLRASWPHDGHRGGGGGDGGGDWRTHCARDFVAAMCARGRGLGLGLGLGLWSCRGRAPGLARRLCLCHYRDHAQKSRSLCLRRGIC